MRVKEFMYEGVAYKDKEGNTYDFIWDNERMGFYTTINGKEVENGFFPAKSTFDRSEAQEQAKALMFKLRNDAVDKTQKAQEHYYQFEKPLSALEQEWIALTKRFMQLNDKELERWSKLGQSGIIRKSLINDTHPAVKK